MNYKYSEPEGRRLLTPENPFNIEKDFDNWPKFHVANPPLIYDGKLKLEVGKVYQGEMFVEGLQYYNTIDKLWINSVIYEVSIEDTIEYCVEQGVEFRKVFLDAEIELHKCSTCGEVLENDEVCIGCHGISTCQVLPDSEMLDTSVKEGESDVDILKRFHDARVTAPVNQEETLERLKDIRSFFDPASEFKRLIMSDMENGSTFHKAFESVIKQGFTINKL